MLSVPDNSQTVFTFGLPYAIPVPDGAYKVKIRLKVATLSIKRVQRQEVVGFGGTGNIQFPFDKYGKSSFSAIELTIPGILDFQEQAKTPLLIKSAPRLKAKEIALSFLNRFIEAVKYVSEEYWVEPARYQDILAYQAYYWDGVNKYSARVTLLDTGVGGIRLGGGHPFQMKADKIQQLSDLLENEKELDTSKLFILNAKDACLQEDYRLATVESVTALEILLYKFILLQGKKVKIPRNELDEFIKTVGLTGNISVVLRMIAKGLEQIDEETIATCRGAITTRNHILHKGLRDVYSTDTEKRIIAIERMIAYLRRLIAKISQET